MRSSLFVVPAVVPTNDNNNITTEGDSDNLKDQPKDQNEIIMMDSSHQEQKQTTQEPIQVAGAKTEDKITAKKDLERLKRYDILNRVPMYVIGRGWVSPRKYYWGSLEIKADNKLYFFVEKSLQNSLFFYFTKEDVKKGNFDIQGKLPASGDLSRLYFVTPRESGFLFSGSIFSGNGMTSLLPPYHKGQWANIEFVQQVE